LPVKTRGIGPLKKTHRSVESGKEEQTVITGTGVGVVVFQNSHEGRKKIDRRGPGGETKWSYRVRKLGTEDRNYKKS